MGFVFSLVFVLLADNIAPDFASEDRGFSR